MSLRARLLVGMAVVAIVLVGASIVITRATESYLIDRVDAQLSSSELSGRGFDRYGDPGAQPGGNGSPEHPPPDEGFSSLYVGLVQPDGSVLPVATPNIAAETLALPEVPQSLLDEAESAPDGHAGPATVGTESDLEYRVVVAYDEHDDHTIVLGLPLNDVAAATRHLIGVEAVTTALILAILALVVFWVMRLGVRPIKQMTRTATAIAGGDLSHRVPSVAAGTEAGELGTALNQMLGRIEEAFDERSRSEARLRRFVADASHELRTPVTTIRGYAELYRAGGLEEEGELRQAMRRTEQEAVRMGALIEDLLLLARLDQGRPLLRAPVDLGVLAVDAASDARAVDPDRPITTSVEEDVTVLGDESRLRQVLGNLVGNAIVHTPPGTPVRIAATREGDRAVLEVRDEGPGMPPDVAANVFERFYRADPARSRHHGGTGLGLAIVKAIVDAHGGTIDVRTAQGEGTTVRVELPGGTPADESPATDRTAPALSRR